MKILDCSNCQLLTKIPLIEGLKSLNCSNCPILKNIPLFVELQFFSCYNCILLISIPTIVKINYLNISKCKWLKISNLKYDENITKLIKLQKWFKIILLNKKLLKLIKKIIPLYFAPSAKGGYMHKKKMMFFLEKL